jgi:hypothetical protein
MASSLVLFLVMPARRLSDASEISSENQRPLFRTALYLFAVIVDGRRAPARLRIIS